MDDKTFAKQVRKLAKRDDITPEEATEDLIDSAHATAFREDEDRQFPDISWLVLGEGDYFCRPHRMQFHTLLGSWKHDERYHPERVARRSTRRPRRS